MAKIQNYENHVRWNPLVHYVVTPLLLLNLIWQIAFLIQEPSWDRAAGTLLAVTLLLLSIGARMQALTVQNRLIRLEETLRYKEILAPDLAEEARRLRTGQIVALRFAPDEELPELVRQTLGGQFQSNKEIKLAVKKWRGDYLRA